MLDERWEWVVIDASVDVKFPNFANVAQKALNVNNHAAQKTSELDMALRLADVCHDPGFQDEPGWKEMAVRSMEDQGIPSSGYAKVILDFTLEFGGGPDAPEIRFMHNSAS